MAADYVTKDTQKPLELLSIVKVAKQYIDGHQSQAEDAGTPGRTFTFLMQRIINRVAGAREVPATMVASYLLQYPAEWESARVWSVYVLPAISHAARHRRLAGLVDPVTQHDVPAAAAPATNQQRTAAAIHAAVHDLPSPDPFSDGHDDGHGPGAHGPHGHLGAPSGASALGSGIGDDAFVKSSCSAALMQAELDLEEQSATNGHLTMHVVPYALASAARAADVASGEVSALPAAGGPGGGSSSGAPGPASQAAQGTESGSPGETRPPVLLFTSQHQNYAYRGPALAHLSFIEYVAMIGVRDIEPKAGNRRGSGGRVSSLEFPFDERHPLASKSIQYLLSLPTVPLLAGLTPPSLTNIPVLTKDSTPAERAIVARMRDELGTFYLSIVVPWCLSLLAPNCPLSWAAFCAWVRYEYDPGVDAAHVQNSFVARARRGYVLACIEGMSCSSLQRTALLSWRSLCADTRAMAVKHKVDAMGGSGMSEQHFYSSGDVVADGGQATVKDPSTAKSLQTADELHLCAQAYQDLLLVEVQNMAGDHAPKVSVREAQHLANINTALEWLNQNSDQAEPQDVDGAGASAGAGTGVGALREQEQGAGSCVMPTSTPACVNCDVAASPSVTYTTLKAKLPTTAARAIEGDDGAGVITPDTGGSAPTAVGLGIMNMRTKVSAELQAARDLTLPRLNAGQRQAVTMVLDWYDHLMEEVALASVRGGGASASPTSGFCLMLRGGPGTGKTYIANSIAACVDASAVQFIAFTGVATSLLPGTAMTMDAAMHSPFQSNGRAATTFTAHQLQLIQRDMHGKHLIYIDEMSKWLVHFPMLKSSTGCSTWAVGCLPGQAWSQRKSWERTWRACNSHWGFSGFPSLGGSCVVTSASYLP